MILEVGKAGKVRFIRGIKKTNVFEIGPHGMVVEREKNTIYLYATNARCSEIYAIATLGDNKLMKGKSHLMAAAYTQDIMVLDAGEVLVVVDYEKKQIAVNKPEIPVVGKRDWAENPRMEWEPYFNAMFGLPVDGVMMPPPVFEKEEEAAEPEVPQTEKFEEFWTWFEENEDQIVDKTIEGGDAAETISARIRLRLAMAFPYEKPENIEFRLGGDGEKNELAVYHFNRERMMADAAKLGEAMPESLKERWNYYTEA